MARRFYFALARSRSRVWPPPRILRSRFCSRRSLASGRRHRRRYPAIPGLFEAAARFARRSLQPGSRARRHRALRRSHRRVSSGAEARAERSSHLAEPRAGLLQGGQIATRRRNWRPACGQRPIRKWFCCSRIAGSGRERTPKSSVCWRRSTSQTRATLLSLICWAWPCCAISRSIAGN